MGQHGGPWRAFWEIGLLQALSITLPFPSHGVHPNFPSAQQRGHAGRQSTPHHKALFPAGRHPAIQESISSFLLLSRTQGSPAAVSTVCPLMAPHSKIAHQIKIRSKHKSPLWKASGAQREEYWCREPSMLLPRVVEKCLALLLLNLTAEH